MQELMAKGYRGFADKHYLTVPTCTLRSLNTTEIKILLLENVNMNAVERLVDHGYRVEYVKSSLNEEELMSRLANVHAIGIRSKTIISKKVIDAAKNLMVIACFCIGTNQVDLEYAASKGIAVFNSPFSNSRSVAELVMAEIVALSRQLGDRNTEMHSNIWNKVSKSCFEVRGKTLGIVGYGHIGSQLSVLAEAFGMKVLYYDVLQIMALGLARQINNLHELLSLSDFVSVHIPESEENNNFMGSKEFEQMKDGSYFINASRGSVVDITALIDTCKSGKLWGAALDVYPNEPRSNTDVFDESLNSFHKELMKIPNLILTPHIGGSTEEAQRMIGLEVSECLIRYIKEGNSVGAVNFPEVFLRMAPQESDVRLLFIHRNVPGVLKNVNDLLQAHNIRAQFSDSLGSVAYLIADISGSVIDRIQELHEQLAKDSHALKVRMLY